MEASPGTGNPPRAAKRPPGAGVSDRTPTGLACGLASRLPYGVTARTGDAGARVPASRASEAELPLDGIYFVRVFSLSSGAKTRYDLEIEIRDP